MNSEGLILTRTGIQRPEPLVARPAQSNPTKKIRRAEGGASRYPKSRPVISTEVAIIGQPVTVNFRPSSPTQPPPKPD
jgi:hypothetical protein